jgi:hypothetical protein
MASPFEFVKSIGKNQKDLPADEKDYNSFIINRALSYFQDTIFLANEMNKNHHLPGKMQYSFLTNTVVPNRNRFSKWAKPGKDEALSVIKKYYKYNNEKAQYALSILTDEQIEELKLKVEKNGKQQQ